MSSEVKRFDFFAYLYGGVAQLDYHQSSDGSYVRYDDHEREVRWAIAAAIRMQDKCAALEAERDKLREALGGMLEVYGGERDADGLPKHEVELNLIAFASAALAASTGQEVES